MKLDLNKIIELNSQGFTQQEVQKYFEANNYQNIQSFLKGKGVKLTWQTKSFKEIDHSFFNTIDSEIKAYLLGFFYADGCVQNDGRISVRIQKEDECITKLYQKFISPNLLLSESNCQLGAKFRKPQSSWRIRSKQLVEDLAKFGICERKTYLDVSFPNLPEHLVHHFIRGYFDGDGCIHISKDRRNKGDTKCQKIQIVSTWKDFLDKTVDNLKERGVEGKMSVYTRQGKTCDYYLLQIHSQPSINKFYDIVYKDANFFLPRKKEKFFKHNTEITTETKESVAS